MTPTVLVPLDGSPAAEAAIPWATYLAKQANGELRLVGVHAPPAVILDGETLIGSVVPDDSIRERENSYFANIQTQLGSSGVRVVAELVDGSVVTSLVEYAARLKPAWIVMLSHARGPVARFFLGETAVEFVRRSPSPVLLIHSGDADAKPRISNVLVPLDGSELAERMLGPATELAKAVGAKATLLMALAAVPDIEPNSPAAAKTNAERYLQQLATKHGTGLKKVHCKVVSHGGAAATILSEAKTHDGSVIAMSTHGRGGLSKLVWGSVADEVVRHATCPVLVLRPLEN